MNLHKFPNFRAKIREGSRKKNPEKVWSFAKPPSDPPRFGLFSVKKIDPHFFVGKCIYNGQNKFYAWSH